MRSDFFNVPTKQQLAALATIEELSERRGVAPTMSELAGGLGLAAKSGAHHYVFELARKGLVTFERTGRLGHAAARTLRLTDKGRRVLTLWQQLRSSGAVRGEYDLLLSDKELVLVRNAKLPLGNCSVQSEGNKHVIVFERDVERDFWVRVLVQEMAEEEE